MEEMRVMEIMYGKKVLEKLVEAWERERENLKATEKYIAQNAVFPPLHFFRWFQVLTG